MTLGPNESTPPVCFYILLLFCSLLTRGPEILSTAPHLVTLASVNPKIVPVCIAEGTPFTKDGRKELGNGVLELA